MSSWVAKMMDATLLSSEVLVAKPKRFVREVLRMPDGQEIEWYFADTTPSVMVVPDGKQQRFDHPTAKSSMYAMSTV